MTLQLSIDDSMFERLPGLRVAITTATLNGPPDAAAIDEHWTRAWASFRGLGLASATAHAQVAAYRTALKAAGIRISDFPPAIESLTRRALKQAEPFRINAIVDFYNGVCLGHVVPSGGMDIDAIAAATGAATSAATTATPAIPDLSLELRSAREGDRFTAMGASESEAMAVGELAWFSGPLALSRHILWRQSAQSLVSPDTRRLVFISEYVGGIDDETAQRAAAALRRGAEQLLAAHCEQVLLTRDHPAATLSIG